MRNTAGSEGVCPACRFGSDCMYEAAARRPILQCEQFEPAPMPPRTPAAQTPAIRLAGLCSNCDFRDACIYPKPEGGVWRCEEYR